MSYGSWGAGGFERMPEWVGRSRDREIDEGYEPERFEVADMGHRPPKTPSVAVGSEEHMRQWEAALSGMAKPSEVRRIMRNIRKHHEEMEKMSKEKANG